MSSCVLVAILTLMAATAGAGDSPPVHHRARIVLDPAAHTIAVSDTIRCVGLQSASTPVEGVFGEPDGCVLHRNLILRRYGFAEPFNVVDVGFGPLPPDSMQALPDSTQRWLFPTPNSPRSGPDIRDLVLEYSGQFHQSVEGMTFTRENVGGEISATISKEGIYLAADAYWLPWFGEDVMVTHTLTIETPLGWEPVTQGERIRREEIGDRLVTVWQAEHPSDGLTLVAYPFHVTEERHGDVTIATYLLEEDPQLSALYLERTRHYLDLYGEMIGPYPYAKFATVENWFPTGYGMPSWTLLGSQVMRLPFIPYTSFGHEICHNWWGNSVFVGEGGNWCEGLTSFCADYEYKREESPAAAREYRRNLLKDYAAYVKEGSADFPLAEFASRHSGATRAVGYGKSMMVFELIEQLIGREAFRAGMREVYAMRRFRRATWDDFLDAFGRAGGRDLSFVKEQWVERAGAPVLQLLYATRDGDTVAFKLQQGAPPYDLEIPVAIETPAGRVERTVHLARLADSFEIDAPGATELAVDPDHHLFRRLLPGEIEPTLSQVLAEEVPQFVLPAGPPAAVEAAREFARAYTNLEEPVMFEDACPPTDVRPGTALSSFLLNPPPGLLADWTPPGVTVTGGLVFIEGRRYSLEDHDVVFAVLDPHDPLATDLVVLCQSPARLPSLAGRIQHYGKYSWLVFPVRGSAERGNWEPPGSPLRVRLEG